MATRKAGRDLVLNQSRIYTLADKIAEQPISFFSTDITTSRRGSSRQTHPGRCYDFLGVDEYVSVPDHADFSFGDDSTDSPFSLSAWMNMDTVQFFKICGKYDSGGINEFMFGMDSVNKFFFQLFDDSESAAIGRQYNTALTSRTGEWIHTVATYDGNSLSSGVKLYLNGVRADDVDFDYGSYTAMEASTTPFQIGFSGNYADGKLHDVRIHSKELTQTEVWEIYHNHTASGYEIGWWKCEEGGGDISFDSSGGGHHGTVENATLSTFHVSSSTLPYSFLNEHGYSGGRYFPGAEDVNCLALSNTDLNPGTGDYTIDGWFFNTNSGTARTILSKGGSAAGIEGYWINLTATDTLATKHSNGTTLYQVFSDAAVPYGWNYFAMVVNRDYAVQQYLNLLDVSITSQDEQVDVGSANMFSIGAYNGGSFYCDSFIGTIRYTSRALTLDEVRDTYNNGFTSDADTKMIAQLDDYGKYVDIVGDRIFTHETTDPIYIPVNEFNNSLDVSGEQLKYSGEVKYNTSIGSMCADFDGTNDYIIIPDNDLLSFVDADGDLPFSISTWAYIDDATGFIIMCKDTSAREWHFYVDAADDKLKFVLLTDSSNYIGKKQNEALTDYEGELIHICGVYDGTEVNDAVSLYINGVKASVSDIDSGTYAGMANTTDPVHIGENYSAYADGRMCDVRVYDKALTQAEILDVMIGNRNGNEVAWYPLAEGNGELIHDASGNGLHGIATNVTLSTFWGQTQEKFHYGIRMGASDGIYFNGSTAYGLVDNADAGDLDPGTSDFTIEMIMQTSVDAIYFLDFNEFGGYEWYINTGGKQKFIIDDGTSTSGFSESDTTVDDGLIHHVAITFNRDGDATYYLDGVADGTFDITGEQLDLSISADFYLGVEDTPTLYFDGNIYGFRYSNRVRTADEIFNSYKYGLVSDSDTVALWDFRNGEGVNVTDENAYRLTMTNTARARVPALSTNLSKDALGYPIQHIGGGLNGGGEIVDFTGGIAAPRWNDHRLGYCEFNGTDDYIDCGDADELSFGDASTDTAFSMSAWINMDDATSFPIITKQTTTLSTHEWRFWSNGTDTLLFNLIDPQPADAYYIGRSCDSGGMTDYEGEWIYVAVTYDATGVSSGFKIYINGVQSDTTDSTYGAYVASHNTTTSAEIGRINAVYADGKIRDIKIYGEELTAAQVSEDYKLGGTNAGLIRDYKLYKDAYDSSNYKGHGELVGTNINFPLATVDTIYEQGDYLPRPFYKKSTDNSIIECVTAGDMYSPFNRVYGIWEFDFYKDLDAAAIILSFISDRVDIGGVSYLEEGYRISLTGTESVLLMKATGGGSSILMETAASSFNNDTWYNVKIVRNETLNQYVNGAVGTFAIFVDGVLSTASTGTNPVTDNTYTSSRYMIVDVEAGDKIRNLKFNDELVNLSKFQVESGTYKVSGDKENNFILLERPLMAQGILRPVFRYVKTGESNG